MGAESLLDMIFRTRKVGTGDKDALSGLKGISAEFQALTGVNLSAAGAIALVGTELDRMLTAAADAETVDAQLNAALESTGGAAGLAAEQLNSLATQLMYATAVEDETIKSGEALMLTFTRISGEVFPGAMQAALDMSQALEQDLNTSVMQLGKALNDPVQGITALRRVGVAFTDDQEALIKALVESGDAMGAQQIILNELSTEFGGSAAAAADTYAGKLAQLKNNVGNLEEAVGGKLIPILSEATGTLNLLLTWQDQVNAAVENQRAVILDSSTSYEDYRDQMIALAIASGDLDQNFTVLTDDSLQMAEDMNYLRQATGMLDEEQWRAAQYAGQFAAAMQTAGEASETAQGPVNGLAEAYSAAAGDAGLAATSAHEMAEASERLAAAEADLKTAQDELRTAQENWQEGAGGQMAGMLEAAGLKGDELYNALAVLDGQMGTNEESARRQKDAMAGLVDQYARTGDLEAFRAGLQELEETFLPLNESVKKATELVDELQAKLNDMAHTYNITVRVNAETGALGSGGSGGSGVTDSTGEVNGESEDVYGDKLAEGGRTYRSQWHTVGEFGPERVKLPAGSVVYPSEQAGRSGPLIGTAIINNGMDLDEIRYRLGL